MLIELTLFGAASFWMKRKQQKKKTMGDEAVISINVPGKLARKKPASPVNVQRLLKDIKKSITADGRQQLQLDMTPELRQEFEKTQKQNSRQLWLSTGATGLAVFSILFPVLTIFGILAVLYISREIFYLIRKDFKKGHYLSVYVIIAISIIGMIVTGQLVLAALAGLLSEFMIKILDQVESHSQHQLINTFSSQPEQVWVLKNGVEIQLDFHAIRSGDTIIINAGEVIPIDGKVQSGEGRVDQHVLTGESQPVEKSLGDSVFSSTLLLTGRLVIEVETTGQATVAAKIAQVLNQTQNYTDTLTNRGRKIADKFVPVTLGLAAITWPLLGAKSALAISWAGLGENMVTLGPLSVLSYLQILSHRGILIKDGRVFESLKQVDTIVFDKTGTLTLEQPTLSNIYVFGDFDAMTVLYYAAAAEYRQPHPVARAILAKAKEENLELPELGEASYKVGYGIKVKIEEKVIRVGSARFMEREDIALPKNITLIEREIEADSHSLVYVSINQQVAGILQMQPTIRPEIKDLVCYLKQRKLKLYIMSGDHENPTRYIAETLGIDDYFSQVLPENKSILIKELQEQGRVVCFIGDGINDAIALKSAQVSISLKGASTAATDTAQIIFMDGTLNNLQPLYQLADEFETTMKKNLASSIVPGVLTIGGVYLLHFSVAVGMGIFFLGSAIGLGNTLLPLAKYQKD